MAKKFTPMQFSRALRDLAKVPSRISKPVAKRLKRDQEKYFSLGVDPYRNPWVPLKASTLAKGRHPPPLTDTRRGRRGIKFIPMRSAGVRIVSTVPYLGYHMRRTMFRAARKFLPEGVLPRAWAQIIEQELVKDVKRTLG